MSDDKRSDNGVRDPAHGADRRADARADEPPDERAAAEIDDVLHRAARDIRATPGLEAFVPLTPAEREVLADRAIAQVLGPESAPTPAPVPMRRRRRGVPVYIAGVVAAAALAVVLVPYLGGRGRIAEPLATYAMQVEGEQPVRGAAPPAGDAPVVVRPETRVVIRLEAARSERDALIRLVLVRDGNAALLDPAITRSKAGAFEIAGAAAELFGAQTDGAGEIVAVLGRALPDDDAVRALARAGTAPAAVQVLRRAIVFAGFSHTAVDALLGGCSAVLAGAQLPRCEVATGAALALWVGVPADAAVEVRIDGARVAAAAEARGGGSAFVVDARPGALTVTLHDRAIAGWELAPAPRFAQIEAFDRARRAGRVDDAAAALDAATPSTDEERLEIVRRRARLARLRGEVAAERARRDEAVVLARRLGRVSVVSDETVAILYGLMDQHALAEAAQLVPVLDAHGAVYAEGAVRRDLVHGLLASELGDLGAALAAFERARATADRIGDASDRAATLGPLADVLQLLGRGGEARALIDAELERADRDVDVCARVEALTNAGWLLRDQALSTAQRLADQATALAAERCTRRLPIALVNQGWLLAAGQRFREARAALDRLAALERDTRVATWAMRLEAEVVLAEDPARAERYARQLGAHAAALCSTELAYEAHLLRARALAALARPTEAAAAFQDAERALALWSRLVPLGEGRETFFDRHDQLALTAIPFFLGQVRRGVAGADLALAQSVRRSIARFVTSLAAGGRARVGAERGERSRDRISRQFALTLARWPARAAVDAPGEAMPGVCAARDAAAHADDAGPGEPPARDALLVHPTAHGWLVIAWRPAGPLSIDIREVARAADEPPAAQVARIADAAAAMLAGATRVQLHVHRSLAALPLDRALATRLAAPVAFAVTAAPPPPATECRDQRRALLVSNPQRNLWAASASAPVIHDALARLGFAVDSLDGPAATRAAIEQRLADPCTAVFEYDGHAVAPHPPGASTDRIDDALLLAGGDTLTAADILALGRVPPAVVLDGCTTAAPEGLGLAHAFVLAGASQVVASLDEVPAEEAARFTQQLLDGAPPHTALDLVPLFARSIARADLAALRVYER